ncbi:hypothetical protein BGZ65_009936 [Modicella reniformis]|uniref:SH3 domain-containing protein n=1 Tax=Modicella reniformis TaxID=1440133 RepID=A0A9P6LTI1_9FUNG|nr:hypothetical protein BGZ65_009936 [Modicella reniformis]
MAQFGIVMQPFNNTDEFDKSVFNATGFQTTPECTGYTHTIRIPYQNTLLCTIAIQDQLSGVCKGQPTNVSSNLCDSSCTLYQQGLTSMIEKTCPTVASMKTRLVELNAICSRKKPNEWMGLHDNNTAKCINSLKNEQGTCDDNSSSSSKTGLSSGALGGIVIGSIIAAALIAFALFLCIRRARKVDESNGSGRRVSGSSGRYNISGPKIQEEGYISGGNPSIPMTTLPHIEHSSLGLTSAIASAGTGGLGSGGGGGGGGAGMAAKGGVAVAGVGAGAKAGLGTAASGKHSYAQALYPYQASMADELDLTPGDIINVIRVFDDGWAVGTNMSTSREGAFPIVCVMFVDESALDDDFDEANMQSMQPMTLREEDQEGKRPPSGRNSPRSSLPSRSSSPVNLPRRNSSIRDSTVIIVPGTSPMTSSPLAGGNGNGAGVGVGSGSHLAVRDTMATDNSSLNRWWEGEK